MMTYESLPLPRFHAPGVTCQPGTCDRASMNHCSATSGYPWIRPEHPAWSSKSRCAVAITTEPSEPEASASFTGYIRMCAVKAVDEQSSRNRLSPLLATNSLG